MKMEETFFAHRFAMLRDKFGTLVDDRSRASDYGREVETAEMRLENDHRAIPWG